MADLFDNPILCKKCNKAMKPGLITKNGFNLRIVKCSKCNNIIIHPVDKQEYENFMRLKQKEFEVKMRMVGNSYAISIPKEIVDFMKESEKIINDMVRLSFDNANKLSLIFNTPELKEQEGKQGPTAKSRIIKTKEVKIVKNNKPLLYVKQFYDSAHPERNKNIVLRVKNKNPKQEEE